MENLIATEDQLRHIKWIPCIINDQEFIIKYLFHPSSYHLMLYDFSTLYSEQLQGMEIMHRCLDLNPLFEVPAPGIVKQLEKSLDNSVRHSSSGNYKLSIIKKDSMEFTLKSESLLAEIHFSWIFRLCSSELSLNFVHIVQPLMGMVSELTRRNSALIKIIHEKDHEIDNCKDNSSKASQKNRETEKFHEIQFERSMEKSSSEMLNCLKSSKQTVFEDNLYTSVATALEYISRQKSQNDDVVSKKIKTDTEDDVLPSTITSTSEMNEEKNRRILLQQKLDSKIKTKNKKKAIHF